MALLGLAALSLALLALSPVPRAAAAITPAVSLDPSGGPCSTRPVIQGTDFPGLSRVVIFSQRTDPPGEKVSQPIAEALTNQYGIFKATLLAINGDCIDLDSRTPDGTKYLITAAVPGVVQAGTTFTIDRTPPPGGQCFPTTGQCLQGRFLAHWQQHGGLARNGYPLSGEFTETLEDGREYTVQYFERVRLEYHPENQPPYDVLVGQFGRRILSAAYAGIHDYAEFRRVTLPVEPIAGRNYVPETGHHLDGRFLAFWQANGGLAQFGYPITEERTDTLEDGQRYTTQYFERGRLELHPENAAPYDILIGQFGRQIMAENALLTGNFAKAYFADPIIGETLGSPRGPVYEAPGAAQLFQRGMMIWRGDLRGIYVFSGKPTLTGAVLQENPGVPYFADTWEDGQPAGGGPAPEGGEGTFLPRRGFYKLWQGQERVRAEVGYAITPEESGYTLRVQDFGGGLLILGDTPAGRIIYAVRIQRSGNSGSPVISYVVARTERDGPAR